MWIIGIILGAALIALGLWLKYEKSKRWTIPTVIGGLMAIAGLVFFILTVILIDSIN